MSATTNVPAAPTRAQMKPFKDVKTIGEALRHPDMVDRFQQAVPRHLSPERMLRVCALAIQKTPKLADCDMMTLLGGMLGLASLGLEPNTPLGHAYLIPFDKRAKVNGAWQVVATEVQVIIGYKGYIDLARRSGSMVSIHADVVYEGDTFSFEYGSGMHLKHIPQGAREGRVPVWAYAHAKLQDGEAFEVLPYAQVLKIRDGSQGYQSALRGRDHNPKGFAASPWVAHEHEMAAKTMVRRLSKMLPMSIEMANAAALDQMSETGRLDMRALATAPMRELADMSGLGGINLDLGEHDFADMGDAVEETSGAPVHAPVPPAARPTAAPPPRAADPVPPPPSADKPSFDRALFEQNWRLTKLSTRAMNVLAAMECMSPLTALKLGREHFLRAPNCGATTADEIGRAVGASWAQRAAEPQATAAPPAPPVSHPAPAPQSPAALASPIDYYMADEYGEMVDGDDSHTRDPVVFAERFVARWHRSSNPEALRENNADVIADARSASPEAAEVLDELDRAAVAEDAPPADDAVNPVPAPTVAVAVAVPTKANGSPDLNAYVAAIRASLAAVTAETADAWLALNEPAFARMPKVTKGAVHAAIDGRLAALDLPPRFAQPAPDAAAPARDADRERANDRLAEILACKTADELKVLCGGSVMTTLMSRWKDERPELAAEIKDAAAAHLARLKA